MRIELTSSGNAGRKWKKKNFKSCILIEQMTYALVIANVLCLPEESKKTFALTTLSPRFLSACIYIIRYLSRKDWKKVQSFYTQNTCTRNLNEAEHRNWYEPRKKTLQNYICKPGRRHYHTVSRRAPRRSPKVISTIVAFGSESWSIITLGVGTVSVSLELPSC